MADQSRVNVANLGPHYDRQGRRITFAQFALTKLRPPRRDIVGRTDHGDATISTVWLGWTEGRDHHDRPLIFESAIFYGDDRVWVFGRYATEEDAAAGHAYAVGWWRINAPIGELNP